MKPIKKSGLIIVSGIWRSDLTYRSWTWCKCRRREGLWIGQSLTQLSGTHIELTEIAFVESELCLLTKGLEALDPCDRLGFGGLIVRTNGPLPRPNAQSVW